jgi:signal peptidase II
MPRRWKIFLIVAMITLVADHSSKYWARHSLPVHPDKCAIPDDVVAHKCVGVPDRVIDGFWDWRLSFNPGSAFGLFDSQTGARIFLSIVGVLAVGAMLWMLRKAKDEQRLLAIALGLVAGGAVGNLLDRMYFGVVTDFVLWRYHSKEWPVFNVADVALVIGVGMMFFDVGKEPDKKKAKKSDVATADAA